MSITGLSLEALTTGRPPIMERPAPTRLDNELMWNYHLSRENVAECLWNYVTWRSDRKPLDNGFNPYQFIADTWPTCSDFGERHTQTIMYELINAGFFNKTYSEEQFWQDIRDADKYLHYRKVAEKTTEQFIVILLASAVAVALAAYGRKRYKLLPEMKKLRIRAAAAWTALIAGIVGGLALSVALGLTLYYRLF